MAITPLPTPVPSTSDPANFDTRADDLMTALPGFVDEVNAFAATVTLPVSATSGTSNAIGTGDKTFDVSAGLGFLPGYPVVAAYTTSPANQMRGVVKTYSGTTLVITVASVDGSGTYTAWTIGVIPSTNKATAVEVAATTDDVKYVTAKVLADASAWGNLTDAATIAWDASTGWNKKVVQTAARTIGAPTNLKDGVTYSLLFDCGGFTPSWNSIWDFGAAGTPVPVTTATKWHLVTGIYNATLNKLLASYRAPA